jgi:1-pyrroline-5-carboxylate dehydrogenase
MPFHHRAAIFLKAADLLSSPEGHQRYHMMAATMLGQGKSCWQAEIDCIAELVDFWRFNVKFAEEIYQQQPPRNNPGVWNRLDFRPLVPFSACFVVLKNYFLGWLCVCYFSL